MTDKYWDVSYNPITGCLHGTDICPTSPTCWARTLNDRFPTICRGDFTPRKHPDRYYLPYRWRKPRMIFVGNMGDMFGDRMFDGSYRWSAAALQRVFHVVRLCPEHTFLFLTKAGHNLLRLNPWPDNAWAGISAWDGESLRRAGDQLYEVEARVAWISLEPLLGRVSSLDIQEAVGSSIDWLVVGAQTGKGAKPVAPEQIDLIRDTVNEMQGLYLWEKDNLRKYVTRPLVKERP